MSSFQGVGIEEFCCIQRCPHFMGWNRGVLLYTKVSSFQEVGIEEFHCIFNLFWGDICFVPNLKYIILQIIVSDCVNIILRLSIVDINLNPVLKLLTAYVGHPSYTLLSETFRNQIFSMPRPPLCRTQQQQQLTEREWYEYAHKIWITLKKSDLVAEYEHLLHTTSPN